MSQTTNNSMNIYKELISYIETLNNNNSLLHFREANELSYLKEWLRKKPDTKPIEKELNNLSFEESLNNCDKCQNVYNKSRGVGSGENGIFIVLNRPKIIIGSERERLRKESISLLKKMVQAIGLEFEQCYIANLIKCESNDALNRPSIMFKNCESVFKKELMEKAPSIVIVMGNDMPLKQIKNENSAMSWHTIDHPVALIKNPALKRPAWETLKKIKKAL